ncbi:MAG: Holliday junction resolvase RuvX [Fimbriimonadales bacterium]
MRILGVDYGLRRIGLAIGESEVKMAFARTVLLSSGHSRDAAAVYEFFVSEGCELVVLGLPVLDDGREGEQAALTRTFGDVLVSLGAPVEYVDERYSSSSALRGLSHLSSREAKGVLDAEAARLILETYFLGC